MLKKALSITLAILIIFAAIPFTIPAYAATEMKDSGLNYTESTDIIENPFMGQSRSYDLNFNENGLSSSSDNDPNKPQNPRFTWYYVNINHYSQGGGGEDKPITEASLTAFSQRLQDRRNNGGSAIIRFVYDWDGKKDCEPDDFNMILTHIKQLCEVASEYPDVVLGFECGIIGVFGEMHSSRYLGKKYVNEVIDAYLDNTPESMVLMVRKPVFITDYLGISREELSNLVPVKGEKAYRLSYFNDGYMNTPSDVGTWGTREQDLKFLASQSEHAPYGGEFGSAYGDDKFPHTYCYPWNAIPEMYYTHLNFQHGTIYKIGAKENNKFGYDQYIYGPELEEKWKAASNEQIEAWEKENIIVINDWWKDKAEEGEKWWPDNSAFYGLDCHQFISAHLGYRLVLRNSLLSDTPQAGETLTLEGSIENTGFSNILHNPNTQIVLIKDGIAYTCDVNLNAADLKSCKTYNYRFTLSLPKSMEAGDYEVYMRLSGINESFYSMVKAGIKFANADNLYNENLGANKLGTITVSNIGSTTSAANDVFTQIDNPKAGASITEGSPALLGAGFDAGSFINLSYNIGDMFNLSALNLIPVNQPATYQWYKDDAVLSNQSELTIPKITETDTGVYKLIVTTNDKTYETTAVNVSVTNHVFSGYTVITQPTCSSIGTAERTCSDCGLTETKTLPALSHAENPVTVPATCTTLGEASVFCQLCNEKLSIKYLDRLPHNYIQHIKDPTCVTNGNIQSVCIDCGHEKNEAIKAPGHNYTYTLNGDILNGVCTVCSSPFEPKQYTNVVFNHHASKEDLNGDITQPVNISDGPVIMVGPGGFTPSYQTVGNPKNITFLFKVANMDSAVTLSKLRTLTNDKNSPSHIVDSNNVANYNGTFDYNLSENGVWAFTFHKQVMNYTGNAGFGGISWAAFFDPLSTKGTASLKNTNATFDFLGIYEDIIQYDIVYADAEGNVLKRCTGNYNGNVEWTNLITQVHSADTLYDGETPTKQDDANYIYIFDGWVDSNQEAIDMVISNVIAYPKFRAVPKDTGIVLSEADNYVFQTAKYGYGKQAPLPVTVTNTTNSPIDALSVTLSGEHADNFTLSTSTINSLGIYDSDSFTVLPKTDLSPGTYTADVTVSDTQNEETFHVEFTVVKRNITVTAVNKVKKLGSPDPKLTYTVTPALIGNDSLSGSLKYTGSDAGSYDIVQDVEFSHPNYQITFVKGTMTIKDPKPSVKIMRGDANLDNTVDLCDVLVLQKHIAKLKSLTGNEFLAGNVYTEGNSADSLDIIDLLALQQYLAEFENIFKIGEYFTAGEDDARTVYVGVIEYMVNNNELGETPRIHYWGGEDSGADAIAVDTGETVTASPGSNYWNGTAQTFKIYSIELPNDATGMKFRHQTNNDLWFGDDISIDLDDNTFYLLYEYGGTYFNFTTTI